MRRIAILTVLLLAAYAAIAQTVTLPAASSVAVALTWTGPACSTCSFTPYRMTGTCPAVLAGTTGWTQLPTTAVNVGHATDTTVAAGSTYSYVVETVQGATNSGPSNCVTVTVPNVPAPATALTATGL